MSKVMLLVTVGTGHILIFLVVSSFLHYASLGTTLRVRSALFSSPSYCADNNVP